ncbi:MAG: hypothetical protein WCQ30_08175, partial [Bacteroidales bacterium]
MRNLTFIIFFCASFLFIFNTHAQTKNSLSEEEQQALAFLKAYMPLSDIADYDEDFFHAQVKTA